MESKPLVDLYSIIADLATILPQRDNHSALLDFVYCICQKHRHPKLSIWLKRMAKKLNWKSMTNSSPTTPKVGYHTLLIELQPDSSDPTLYHPTVWFWRDGNPLPRIVATADEIAPFLKNKASPYSLETLQQGVGEIVAEQAKVEAIVPDLLRIEFFLPYHTLSEAVERWPLKKSTLGCEHVVVVRSQARLVVYQPTVEDKSQLEQLLWYQRWQQLQTQAKTKHQAELLQRVINYEIDDGLDIADNRVGAVVMFTPSYNHKLDDGCLVDLVKYQHLPVILWPRDYPESASCPAKVQQVLTKLHQNKQLSNLQDLPQLIKRKRSQFRHASHHPIHKVILLWDDPTRLPPLGRATAQY